MPSKKKDDGASTLSQKAIDPEWDEIFDSKPNVQSEVGKARHKKGGASVEAITAKVDWAIYEGKFLTEERFSQMDKKPVSARERAIKKTSSQTARWASCS